MIEASCHCGNVQIKINDNTETLTSCNCSMCNRVGALWGYFAPEDVEVVTTEQATNTYRWGDKYLDFHHCGQCGSTTHYTPRDKTVTRMAVNFRMVEASIVKSLKVRKFDGADTWKFLDE